MIRTIVDSGFDAAHMDKLLKHGSKKLKDELLQSIVKEMKAAERKQEMNRAPKEVQAAFKMAKKMANTRVNKIEHTSKQIYLSMYDDIEKEVLASKTGQKLTRPFVKEFKEWFSIRHSFPAEMRERE